MKKVNTRFACPSGWPTFYQDVGTAVTVFSVILFLGWIGVETREIATIVATTATHIAIARRIH